MPENDIYNQEILYGHLYQKRYKDAIMFLYNYGSHFKDEIAMQNAIHLFLSEFFKVVRDEGSQNHTMNLWYLYQSHIGDQFKLSAEHGPQLVALLYNSVSCQDLFHLAKDYADDPLCSQIIFEYNTQPRAAEAAATMAAHAISSTPGQQYSTKVVPRAHPKRSFVKVLLRDNRDLAPIRQFLEQLPAVENVLITPKSNRNDDLTAFPREPFTVEETQAEINFSLDSYFSHSPADPIFPEIIATISEEAYFQVLDLMLTYGKNLDGAKGITEKWKENNFRDFFVAYLDSISKRHTATGETFHKAGKADILFRNSEKDILLAAECKMWSGPAGVGKAIDQLLQLYVNWRDERTAVMFFNKTVTGFSQLVQDAIVAVKAHPLCYQDAGKRKDNSYSFIFRNADDPAKIIRLELMLFNFK